MINPNYSFEKQGTIISVKDFLKDTTCNQIESDLKNINKTWWYISMFPANKEGKKNTRYYDGLYINQKYLEEKLSNAATFNAGKFAYSFKRTIDDHFENCWCVICNLKKNFNSPEVKQELSKIVGENVTHMNETFCSKYETGDYLSIHHDKGNGDYAFVFQLTKDWNPAYGGMLNFYDYEKNEVYKTVNPVFNSLTIFKIKNVTKTDHFVSANVSSKTRYAFTGWFSVSN